MEIGKLVEDFLPTGDGTATNVLGLMVTGQALHAVLMERTPDEGTHVVRHFTRRRGTAGYGEDGDDGYGDMYNDGGSMGRGAGAEEAFEGEGAEGNDFTIQFGEDAGEDNLFLGSEFGDLEGAGGETSFSRSSTPSFSLALTDILEECRDAGHPDPAVAFCLPAADVNTLEVHLPDVDFDGGERPSVAAVGRKKLLAVLTDQYDGEFEEKRAAFLPMTSTSNGARFLALVGQPTDPVVSTLRIMRDEGTPPPAGGLLETEVSVFLGLARTAQQHAGSPQASTLVVRTSEEDTLVLFADGPTLRHTETLRSLTVHDAPETICSRVLLLQDEHGIDEVERVLLVGDEGEDELVESFEMFFPEAHVEALREHLPAGTSTGDAGAVALVPAAGAALRLSGHAGYTSHFEDVNLLPKKLLKRRLRMPVSWPVPALLVLIVAASAFFFFRYQHLKSEQQAVRERLETYPENFANASPKDLQARIDSTQAASERYLKGLEVLDQLLMGSDQWSNALAEISRETAAVSGIWVDSWTPQSQAVSLSGNATSRDRIVRLAERTEGEIKSVTFSEIREWPVYSFTMGVPLKTGLPEATKYLREQAAQDAATANAAAPGTSATSSGQNAGGQANTPARPRTADAAQ